ncbi:carbamate kinase [Periweissella cryptocerci]|uniref:Carbamate kinase n=1 Tax=Periweissella cryptocerci TaxID=2506420 RepID=A0A4P6YV28_9LACO|nr:carbamate kinase [Periweissella cryptocerci]QBO36630.1 carbamate kinase [Periweissella cryptocerci]
MKKKRVVVALGGNAILAHDATARGQQKVLQDTACQLVEFIKNGYELIIAHGNGPQVGNLMLQQMAGSTTTNPPMPLDTAVAMTQGSIGYWLTNALRTALAEAEITQEVATVVTQVEVDATDAAYANPSKPIGPFYTANEVVEVQRRQPDWTFKEDAGRGYRRVVPSPRPINVLESNVICDLVNQGVITIAVGGGGIPVIKTGNEYTGSEAVIDKDFAAAKLAELVGADLLVILTTVDNVYINFGQDNQEKLTAISPADLRVLINRNQFAAGSMLPKIEASVEFVEQTDSQAVITSLANVTNFIDEGTGTLIKNAPVMI